MSRQIDDERRYNSDLIAELSDEIATLQAEATVLNNQISLLKNENERLTDTLEDARKNWALCAEGYRTLKAESQPMTPNKETPPWLDDTQPLETLRDERSCATGQALFLGVMLGMSFSIFVIAVFFLLALT